MRCGLRRSRGHLVPLFGGYAAMLDPSETV